MMDVQHQETQTKLHDEHGTSFDVILRFTPSEIKMFCTSIYLGFHRLDESDFDIRRKTQTFFAILVRHSAFIHTSLATKTSRPLAPPLQTALTFAEKVHQE